MTVLVPEMAMPLGTDMIVDGHRAYLDGDAPLIAARRAQRAWAHVPLRERLKIMRKARHLIATHCRELAAAVPLSRAGSIHRNLADTLVAEVLPLAAACRFLERESATILRPAKLGSKGRPFWLGGTTATVHRVPLGVVLMIAPSNYPLFLPGVQALQALVAGNAVLWKPAAGGDDAARSLARLLAIAGLPEGLLQILDTSIDAGIDAIHAGVDKVFVTGHADTGRAVMRELAETTTPAVMELSGCDAVFVLEGADAERIAHALAFGMRLNGSATCMAPRRIFATRETADKLLALLLPKLAKLDAVTLTPRVRNLLDELVLDAQWRGATIARDGRAGTSERVTTTVVTNTPSDATILRTDIFAPLLAFCPVADEQAALDANAACPYALTAAIFGSAKHAEKFAVKLRAGIVLINDLIVSTADPRVSFGGRGASGFGVTRGRDGLLEMTILQTIMTQKKRSLRPYAPTTAKHVSFFASYIEAAHSGSLGARFRGLVRLLSAARDVEK